MKLKLWCVSKKLDIFGNRAIYAVLGSVVVWSNSNPDNGALYVNVGREPSGSANLNNRPRNRNDRFGSFPANGSKLSGQFHCLICPIKFCSRKCTTY